MIFERYDHVKLVKIDDDLMRKGLSEGCVGDVVKVDNNNVSVAFYNLSNLGDFALFVVDAPYLELISKVKDDEQNRLQDIIFEKALYQAACKAAIKAGREYAPEHIQWLVKKLMELPDITFCPHGRPVAMELSKKTLDRQFDRTGF